jgi:hypothetical protein
MSNSFLENSGPGETRRHLLIAGTGRTGTSLLVRMLTACGLDTELSRNAKAFWDPTANAGLETIPLLAGEHPYVVKSPWSHQFIQQLLDNPAIHVDGVLVPVRRLEEAAASRIVLEIQQMYRSQPALLDLQDDWTEWAAVSGGVTYSLQPLDVARILAHSFHRLIEALVEREIPVHFLAFPRFCTDLDYLRRALGPILPTEFDLTTFRERIAPLIEPDKVRMAQEIAETKSDNASKTSEAAYPALSSLHRASLKREVKRLSDELATARTQLQMLAKEQEQLTNELSQLRVESDKLRAELSERTNDGEQLRQRIDAIHASICWRLTSPIRWFHKQIS